MIEKFENNWVTTKRIKVEHREALLKAKISSNFIQNLKIKEPKKSKLKVEMTATHQNHMIRKTFLAYSR